ncbi:uncharacterized protein EAF01_009620 [Botrytis porri]|uniref:Uncharacterized protein n=1 Tax=Botrytis porri TaxID=87229 RepID=A0A4Z1L3W8_9HELO|nr:uncharacterized protein EAF01_009620 [Botrytis porri]KAF7895658.1 hypothetical protein EAF01_009620 [Botrytis porri]TGO91510.1 hypothetical protein BPOR_0025g00040 [Botrytis porri]
MTSPNDTESASTPPKDETPSNLLSNLPHKPESAPPKLNDNTVPNTPDETQSLAQRIHQRVSYVRAIMNYLKQSDSVTEYEKQISHLEIHIESLEEHLIWFQELRRRMSSPGLRSECEERIACIEKFKDVLETGKKILCLTLRSKNLDSEIHRLLTEKKSTVGKIRQLKLKLDGFGLEGGNQ